MYQTIFLVPMPFTQVVFLSYLGVPSRKNWYPFPSLLIITHTSSFITMLTPTRDIFAELNVAGRRTSENGPSGTKIFIKIGISLSNRPFIKQ